ncbi:hypothetical protein BDZ94DRAFT_1231040 [Collybia nuda]|uniref:HMG domain-containing protein n=1 Tax=Collybia nuda TaxID=64659 RepID=A0A9P5XRL7_9AGAR|nr:hypothetical protein BDZ94DRAFT_1231040 [Collybia nuda]
MLSNIQVQLCPTCPAVHRQYIGPDCRELGLFNLNNHKLFTHDLLDEYTSAYTSSETPFVAWTSVLTRRYEIHKSPFPFINVDIFRNTWFSFSLLQDFDGDMNCAKCGQSPEDIIWDGVTLAFSKKHLLTSLQPPTTIDNNSIIRPNVQYHAHQQLVPNKLLRKLLHQVMNGPILPVFTKTSESLGDNKMETMANVAAASAGLDFIALLEQVEVLLRAENTGAADIFVEHFGVVKQAQGYIPPNQFRHLFLQIAAEESVLQLATRTALNELHSFITSPSPTNASKLVSIPALYDILKLEHVRNGEQYKGSTLSLCQWIYDRGRAVLQQLQACVTTPLEERPASKIEDWRSTGCVYSMPQIRSRPQYPRLTHDQRNDSGGNRGAKCSKYYSQYGQQRPTGGIMGAWCTHSICYGFHCIPNGEGRNDVFSAMVTRWPKPPKRVIYDFACALGPYCLLREPDFFADTLFVIDNFHSVGHSKCAPAAFLSSYSRVDPRLVSLNSSAAECGNGGLSRIRKSVSYMTQTRAVQYTRVFISIWNRNKIQRMKKNKE